MGRVLTTAAGGHIGSVRKQTAGPVDRCIGIIGRFHFGQETLKNVAGNKGFAFDRKIRVILRNRQPRRSRPMRNLRYAPSGTQAAIV
jgi:hypothetical protein